MSSGAQVRIRPSENGNFSGAVSVGASACRGSRRRILIPSPRRAVSRLHRPIFERMAHGCAKVSLNGWLRDGFAPFAAQTTLLRKPDRRTTESVRLRSMLQGVGAVRSSECSLVVQRKSSGSPAEPEFRPRSKKPRPQSEFGLRIRSAKALLRHRGYQPCSNSTTGDRRPSKTTRRDEVGAVGNVRDIASATNPQPTAQAVTAARGGRRNVGSRLVFSHPPGQRPGRGFSRAAAIAPTRALGGLAPLNLRNSTETAAT